MSSGLISNGQLIIIYLFFVCVDELDFSIVYSASINVFVVVVVFFVSCVVT